MIKTGYVVEVKEDKANIRVHRESACGGNCAHCKGCGSDETIIEAQNEIDLKIGETVEIIMDNKKFLANSFFGYGVLVVAMILGGLLGYIIFENDIFSALFMILFLVITLLILRFSFKDRKTNIKIERIKEN